MINSFPQCEKVQYSGKIKRALLFPFGDGLITTPIGNDIRDNCIYNHTEYLYSIYDILYLMFRLCFLIVRITNKA